MAMSYRKSPPMTTVSATPHLRILHAEATLAVVVAGLYLQAAASAWRRHNVNSSGENQRCIEID